MQKVTLKTKEVKFKLYQELIDFHQSNSLSIRSSAKEYAKTARKFLEGLTKKENEILAKGKFSFTENKVNYSSDMSDDEIFDFNISLPKFIVVLGILARGEEYKFENINGWKRQASPPIEAYIFKGMNKRIKIKPLDYTNI